MTWLKRRELIALLGGAAAWPIAARAQQPAKPRRLGVLSQDAADARLTPSYKAFEEGLRELGWVDGQNLAIDWRFSEGKAGLLPRLATELIELRVDLIVAIATPPTLAATKATGTIPIVFVQVADPVALGIVPSLARPGANVTGLSNMLTDFGGKRLQLLKEMLPRATRVAFLWNRANQASALVFRELEQAGKPIGLELTDIGVSSRGELEGALASAAKAGAAAIMLQDDTLISSYLGEIVPLATRLALPIFSLYSEVVDGGGLVSYGPSRPAIYRRGAHYVDRILKGAKPSDLPVEQPVRLELVINALTAKALDIAIPGAVLTLADRVIE
jgi:putative ABC transport system substrate-binding protein